MATSEKHPTYVPIEGTLFVYDSRLDARLERLQSRVDSMQEEGYISPDIDDKMHERVKADQICHSNAIAGIHFGANGAPTNQNHQSESKSAHGPEARNLGNALDYIHRLSSNIDSHVSIQQIREIHILISEGIDEYKGGQYRPDQNAIGGSPYSTPDRFDAEREMEYLSEWLRNTSSDPNSDVIRNAAAAHVWLVQVHPFVDGNGRTSRCLMNLILKRGGVPSVAIREEDRVAYYDSLKEADASDLTPFLELLADRLADALDEYETFASDTVKLSNRIRALSKRMDMPILADYQNEYEQWLLSMRRLADTFQKCVDDWASASPIERTLVRLHRHDEDRIVLPFDKFLKLRERMRVTHTSFFNVDFVQGHRRSARYRFTFRWSSQQVPDSAPISLRVGREVSYKVYSWLDEEAESKTNVPRIREVAYCLTSDSFLVRYSSGDVKAMSILDIAGDFFTDVSRCHFQN